MSDLTRAAQKRDDRKQATKAAWVQEADSSGERKRRYRWNDCPPGRDQNIWDLTLFWEQKREEYGHDGAHRPVVYAGLEYLVEQSGIKDRGYIDYEGKEPGWVKVMRKTIEYFWDWEEEAAARPRFALDTFCQLSYFEETVDYLLRKAAAARRKAAREEEGN